MQPEAVRGMADVTDAASYALDHTIGFSRLQVEERQDQVEEQKALQRLGDESSDKQLEESEAVESEYPSAQGELAKMHSQGLEQIDGNGLEQSQAVELEYPLARASSSRR